MEIEMDKTCGTCELQKERKAGGMECKVSGGVRKYFNTPACENYIPVKPKSDCLTTYKRYLKQVDELKMLDLFDKTHKLTIGELTDLCLGMGGVVTIKVDPYQEEYVTTDRIAMIVTLEKEEDGLLMDGCLTLDCDVPKSMGYKLEDISSQMSSSTMYFGDGGRKDVKEDKKDE